MNLDLGIALGRKKASADDSHREFRVESQFRVPLPQAEINAKVVAQYRVSSELAELVADDEVLSDFARTVAIPDVLPYVREAVASLTQRMGLSAFVLPAIPKTAIHR